MPGFEVVVADADGAGARARRDRRAARARPRRDAGLPRRSRGHGRGDRRARLPAHGRSRHHGRARGRAHRGPSQGHDPRRRLQRVSRRGRERAPRPRLRSARWRWWACRMRGWARSPWPTWSPASGAAIDADAIIAWSRERLANYKVPRHVVALDELPINATGKVVKQELRERAAADAGERVVSAEAKRREPMGAAPRPARARATLRGRRLVDGRDLRRHGGAAARLAPECAGRDLVANATPGRAPTPTSRPRRDVDRRAASRAGRRAGRGRRVPAPELARGRGLFRGPGARRLRARAHRPHLRAQGVSFILEESGAAAYVSPWSYGHVDYGEIVETAAPDSLRLHVVVRRGRPDASSRSRRRSGWRGRVRRARRPLEVLPDGLARTMVAVLAYTSGTTSDPKGVIHDHRTMLGELRHMAAYMMPGKPKLMGSPVTHATGMLGAVLGPLVTGEPIHLIDRWDPGHVARGDEGRPASAVARARRSSSRACSTTPSFTARGRRSGSTRVGLGGAPVPVALGRARGGARHPHHPLLRLHRASVDDGLHTSTTPADRRHRTDGRALAGSRAAARRRRGRPGARPGHAGRDPLARPRPLPRLHRPRGSRLRPSTTRAGTERETSGCWTRTGSSRSPTA